MKDFKELHKDLKELAAALEKAPRAVGAAAVEFFTEGIAQGRDIDGNPFAPRKPEFANGAGRGVLTKRGRLRRSIRMASASPQQIVISTDAPYAQLHNEGGSVPITPNMRRFFWAKFYEARGKVRTNKAGDATPLNKRNTTLAKDAAIWRKLALKRSPMRYPARRFMGKSAALEKAIKKALDDLGKIS